MKLVLAVVHPVRLKAVKEALQQVEVDRFTICDSQEWISASDFVAARRSHELSARFRRMVTLEVVVNDDFLERTVQAINRVSPVMRGEVANCGVVMVVPLHEVISFQPVQRGPGAV
jgi:nitrogen regulatory protein P-II 1